MHGVTKNPLGKLENMPALQWGPGRMSRWKVLEGATRWCSLNGQPRRRLDAKVWKRGFEGALDRVWGAQGPGMKVGELVSRLVAGSSQPGWQHERLVRV